MWEGSTRSNTDNRFECASSPAELSNRKLKFVGDVLFRQVARQHCLDRYERAFGDRNRFLDGLNFRRVFAFSQLFDDSAAGSQPDIAEFFLEFLPLGQRDRLRFNAQ